MVEVKFGNFEIGNISLYLPGSTKTTDIHSIIEEIGKTVEKPAKNDEKCFYYMGFAPNMFYYTSKKSYLNIEKSIIGENRHRNIEVKIVCLNEKDLCEGIKQNILLKLSDKEKKDGAGMRYLENTLHYIENMRKCYGKDVIKVIQAPIPYHLAITEKFGYIVLQDTEMFKNVPLKPPKGSIYSIGIKFRPSDPGMSILRNWFFYYKNKGKNLNLSRLKKMFEIMAKH